MTTVLRPTSALEPGAAAAPAPASPAAGATAHVRRTAEIPIFQDSTAPLRIRFLDPIREIKVGEELRFEVVHPDGGARARVSIEALDFSFGPFPWGEVRVGTAPFVGIVRVTAVHRPVDVYDRPKYEMVATFKARGGAEVETVSQFAVAVSAPVVELRFFVREDGRLDPFHPQQQARALDPARDIRVTPPDAAEVFAEGKRLFLRVNRPSARPRVTITFPNEEVATLEIDLDRATGVPPADLILAPKSALPAASGRSKAAASAAAVAIGKGFALARVGGGHAGALLKRLGGSAVRGGRALLERQRAGRAKRKGKLAREAS